MSEHVFIRTTLEGCFWANIELDIYEVCERGEKPLAEIWIWKEYLQIYSLNAFSLSMRKVVIVDVEWIMLVFIMGRIQVLVCRISKCCCDHSAWRLFEGKAWSNLIKNENYLLKVSYLESQKLKVWHFGHTYIFSGKKASKNWISWYS